MRVEGTENVAAVVVTYNPGDRFNTLMDALRPRVGGIWVIDNGSRQPGLDRVQSCRTDGSGDGAVVELILNPNNRGLAAAQNQGITAVMDAGFKWVLLMDQDGVPDTDMVPELLGAAKRDPDPGGIGVLAPMHGDERGLPAAPVYSRGPWGILRRRVVEPGEVEKNAAFAMASGCLISLACIPVVGSMNEDFFIDYIDYDFSFRVRRAGYRIVVVGAARLSHNLGKVGETKILGKTFRYREHSPDRWYTIYRNRVRVFLSGGCRFPEFIQFEVLSVGKDLVQLPLRKCGKGARFRAMLEGVLDGFRRRGGPRKS